MTTFSATGSIEESEAKAKDGKTTKSTCQWLLVYHCSAKLRNKKQDTKMLEPSILDEIVHQF